jgi:acyl-CoA thioesterase-1
MRRSLPFLVLVACSHPSGNVGTNAPASSSPAPTASAMTSSSAPSASASASASSAPASSAPASSVASTLEAPDAGAPAPKPAPKVVLHAGDSMVGGYGGLTKALEGKYKPLGSKFVRDWQVSVSIQTYARDKHFAELIQKNDPDLVILTLGANDMLVPFPKSLAPFIQAIAKKVGTRECYWLPPVPWTKETGLIQVIKDNAAPCKVFDASTVKVQRGPDGIHPTDKGGIEWADAFFKFYETGGAG